MYFEDFNGIKIFRPILANELEIRRASELHLRSRFSVNKYDNKDDINSILRHQFEFYSSLLAELLPSIASHHFLEFLLYQFDSAAAVEQLHKDGVLIRGKDEQWAEIGSIFRRAVKYIAERIVMLQPEEAPEVDAELLFSIADKIWICAEEMVKYYLLSDATFSVFPNHTILTVLQPGEQDYFIHEVIRDGSDINSRITYDRSNRHRFIPDLEIIFDIEEQDRVIGTAFKAEGVTK